MSGYIIRDADWPADEPAAISFIHGLQKYESAFESNRRLDEGVGVEFFAELVTHASENQGRVFIAELDDQAVGWAVFFVKERPIYVREEQRRVGYISELFVVERARGTGIGKALIAACESWARELGLREIAIGVLAGNRLARAAYLAAGFTTYSEELLKHL